MSATARAGLVAAWRQAEDRQQLTSSPRDYSAAEAAWDELASWKHDHDECLHASCTATVPGHSYCDEHRC